MKGLKLKGEIKQQAIKIPDVNMDLQVSQYTECLSTRAVQKGIASTTQEMNDYAEQAGKSLLLGRRKIAVFAPFQPEYSAFQTITRWQTVALGMIVLVWVLGILIFREKMLITTMAAIIELYLGLILVNVVISLNAFLRSPEEQIDDPIIHALRDADWPSYTILDPLYLATKGF